MDVMVQLGMLILRVRLSESVSGSIASDSEGCLMWCFETWVYNPRAGLFPRSDVLPSTRDILCMNFWVFHIQRKWLDFGGAVHVVL